MAAPAYTARVTPTGQPMEDGYRTLLAFAADPDALMWEKGVTPPGLDGGDSIPVSTMFNDTWRTFAPASLKTLTTSTVRVAYNPQFYSSIVSMINVRTAITAHFPDGSNLRFYGFLRSFIPDELVEGTQPEATATIEPTNWDPVNAVEAAPVWGTGTS